MQSNEIRKRYLDFMKKKGHAIVPSSLLVPENDPTTLFTGSGMQSMLPYLLGENHPLGTRVSDSQKCFRADDIDEVGDNRHTTFFEMLGNWSFGDYFNQEQLPWAFEFLTEEIGLNPNNLYITVFSGSEKDNLPRDTESALIWQKLFAEKGIDAKIVEIGSEERGGQVGMQEGRIFYYDEKKNWWSRVGTPSNMPAGEPGGPDSEMFYDFGIPHDKKYGEYCHPNCDCGRFVEIGNNVFMKYQKKSDGTFEEMPKKNVDFGGGLERITAATNKNFDVFQIDTLGSLVKEIEKISGKSYSDEQYIKSFRIIADHLRGAVFMIGDGIIPSNNEAGYFTRRLLRRAIRHMDLIGVKKNTLFTLIPTIIEKYKDQYPNLSEKQSVIEEEIQKEEEKFRKTLENGLKELRKLSGTQFESFADGEKPSEYRTVKNRKDAGKILFDLFQTYGFPVEMSLEEIDNILINTEGFFEPIGEERKNEIRKDFDEEMKKHRALSKAGAEQKFKGGLADQSEMSVKYHTATHLLHQALHEVLGEDALQKGCNITGERVRFDFSHPQKLTEEEKKRIEDLVNQKIKEALPVTYKDVPLEEAKKLGATGLFGDKYGDIVRIYKIGDEKNPFSFEICGGPHVENTKDLGFFRIKKEEASSAGVRRIKAVLE